MNARGLARQRPDPSSGVNGNQEAGGGVFGRAVAGEGGGRVAQVAAAEDEAKERAAEVEAKRRKNALARRKEVRGESCR